MTGLDYVIIAVSGVSVLFSVIRGAVRELASLVWWLLSGFLALHFAPVVAVFLPRELSSPTARLVVAFIAILLGSLLLFALLSLALNQLVAKAGLSPTDRMLGALFGAVRAVVVLVVLVLLAGLTPLPREPAWRNSLLVPPLQALAVLVRAYLPPALAQRIRYD